MKWFTLSERTKQRLSNLAIVIVLVPMVALGSQVWRWVHSVWAEHWLRKDSKPLTAVVTQVGPKRAFAYRYTVNGKEYTGNDTRDWEEDRDNPLSVGDPITAHVSTSHPHLSCLNLKGSAWMALPLVVLILCFEFILLAILADGILRMVFGIYMHPGEAQDSGILRAVASLFVLLFIVATWLLRRNPSRQVRFYVKTVSSEKPLE